jgi:glutamate racemase
VDSATTTAEAVATKLTELGLLTSQHRAGTLTLLATDGADRFAAVGSRFLGEPIASADVEVVDL